MDHLQGDPPGRVVAAGQVDGAHPATAEATQQQVRAHLPRVVLAQRPTGLAWPAICGTWHSVPLRLVLRRLRTPAPDVSRHPTWRDTCNQTPRTNPLTVRSAARAPHAAARPSAPGSPLPSASGTIAANRSDTPPYTGMPSSCIPPAAPRPGTVRCAGAGPRATAPRDDLPLMLDEPC
jgi:hypothetical protein